MHEAGESLNLLSSLGLTLSPGTMTALAIVLFVATYAMILLEKYVHRTVAAMLGACAVMVLGILTPTLAWASIDFNTIFLLFGMMNIVNVLSRSGFFDLVARRAMVVTRGEPARVLWIFSILTAVFSAFLDNVTTVLFMAPVVVTVVARLGLRPVPYLVAVILASNTGGTATLVGDPPNIIIGSVAGKGFGDFLVNVAPYAAVATVLGIALMHLLMKVRGDLAGAGSAERLRAVLTDTTPIKTNPRLMKQALGVFAVTLLLFMIGHPLGLEAGLVALTTSTFLMLIADLSPVELFEQVEWTTLLFFMGLFIVVGGLEHVGVFQTVAAGPDRGHRRQHRRGHPGGGLFQRDHQRLRGQHSLHHQHGQRAARAAGHAGAGDGPAVVGAVAGRVPGRQPDLDRRVGQHRGLGHRRA